MPVVYSIDSSAKLIRTTCSDPLTFEEVIDHFRILQNDPACVGTLDVLLDVNGMTTLPGSMQLGAVSTAAGSIRGKAQFGNCAIVATRDAVFGTMRMFEALAGRHFRAIRVFRARSEAEQWLAAPSSTDSSEP